MIHIKNQTIANLAYYLMILAVQESKYVSEIASCRSVYCIVLEIVSNHGPASCFRTKPCHFLFWNAKWGPQLGPSATGNLLPRGCWDLTSVETHLFQLRRLGKNSEKIVCPLAVFLEAPAVFVRIISWKQFGPMTTSTQSTNNFIASETLPRSTHTTIPKNLTLTLKSNTFQKT